MSLPGWISKLRDSSSALQWRQLLCLFRQMRRTGFELSDPTALHLVMKASSNVSFPTGESLHGLFIKKGSESHTCLGNSTIDFYAKSGRLADALAVFNSMGDRDSVSWNVIVHGFLACGALEDGLQCFEEARVSGFEPSNSSLVMVVKACRELGVKKDGEKLHGFAVRNGYMAINSLQNCFLGLYAEYDMDSARKLFDEMSDRDIVSWSSLIKGYVYSGDVRTGFEMFLNMFEVGVEPDGISLVSALKACAALRDASIGKVVHGFATRRGLERDLFVTNSFIDVYSKCGEPDSAFKVFEHMSMGTRNNVSWNSMISGFVINEKYLEALSLLYAMRKDGVEADEVTVVNILQICKYFEEALQCKSVHCVVIRRGYESNELVINSMLDAYAKCGLDEYTCLLFERIKRKDDVLWSTMIDGLTVLGRPDEAIDTFKEMIQAKEKPNAVTIVNLLEACSVLAHLKMSKWAHAIAMRLGFASEVAVATAILDMYSKCGSVEASRRVFDKTRGKNIVSWSAMIASHGMNGQASEALALHREMTLQGLKPNTVTTLSVLSACSHGGLVEEGLSFFNSMARDHGVDPRTEHYSCVADMLGRAGMLDSAMEFIKSSPEGLAVNAKTWGSLLSACKSHGNTELVSEALSRVVELEPLSSAGYLMVSSLYGASGQWAEAADVRRLVRQSRVNVIAGYSAVQFGSMWCKFVAGDRSHSRAG